jgi:hypothetical protein
MHIYLDRDLPEDVVVGDIYADMWIVPIESGGWEHRRPYLHEVAGRIGRLALAGGQDLLKEKLSIPFDDRR